jgi:PPOX class probable F420-dependent enzyme
MASDEQQEALLRLLGERRLGVLATIRRNGRPQLSNVNHAYDPDKRLIRVSITDGRAKTYNLRRDPRASYHVTSADGWAWTVAWGHLPDGVWGSTAELSAVAEDPHDAAVEALIDLYRAAAGEHPDWDDYRRAMVADRRLVLSLHIERAYGQPKQG